MPRLCTVCTHADREAIDRALIAKRVSHRGIASQFGLDRSAILRHASTHLLRRLLRQAKRSSADRDARLHARVLKLVGHLEELSDSAASAKSSTLLLEAAKQLRPTLELMGKVTRELQPDTVVNISAALFQRLGVRDEAEAVQVIESQRSYRELPEPDLALRMAEWLRRYLTSNPAQREAVTALLAGSEAVEVPPTEGNGNGLPQVP